jgi:protein RecA
MPPVAVERNDRNERDDRQDRERLKAVELAVGQIEKQFGKGAIMRLGQKGAIQPIECIPTGAISIDYALGVGGVPRGRVIEIFGPESSGKTTLSLQVIAEAQKAGGIAAFVDAEHALDAAYARKLGVDVDNLLVSQPDNGEQALEIVEVLIRSNGVDVVVVDSVAALVPKAEIEGEMGEAQMGLQARLMSQALRKLTGAVSKSKTSLIFINQLREKIGVMFGNPETTTGGRAEVLLLGAYRHPAHRQHQGRRHGRRRPDAREDRQEQGGAAVPRSRVRRHVRRRHFAHGRSARPRRGQADYRQERRVVRLRRRTPGPGPRERQAVSQGQPGHLQDD